MEQWIIVVHFSLLVCLFYLSLLTRKYILLSRNFLPENLSIFLTGNLLTYPIGTGNLLAS